MKTYKYDRWDMFGIKFLCNEKDLLYMLNLQDRIMAWERAYSMPPVLTDKVKAQ